MLFFEIRKLFGEALLVQALFSVACLMLDHVVGNLNVIETSLLALRADTSFVALIEAVFVGGLDDASDALLQVVELLPVKCFIQLHFLL